MAKVRRKRVAAPTARKLPCNDCYAAYWARRRCDTCGYLPPPMRLIKGRYWPMWWEVMGYASPPPLGAIDDGTGHDPRMSRPGPEATGHTTTETAMAKTTKKTAPKKIVKLAPKTVKAGATTKTDKPAKEKKAASGKFTGKTTGLRVQAFQDKLMKANYKDKKSDAALAKEMRAEFPGAVAFTEAHVAGIRSQWNNGKRASQEGEAPAKRLAKFDDEGNEVNPRAGRKAGKDKGVKAKGAAKKAKADAEDEPAEDEEVEEDEDEESDDEESDDEDEE